MKKYFILLATAVLMMAGCAKEYDDSVIKKDITELQGRVDKLETELAKIQSNISSIQTLIAGIQGQVAAMDYVKGVEEIKDAQGVVIGYKFIFANSESKTFYLTDTGCVGVVEIGGKYYWAVGGQPVVDANGNKVEVSVAPQVAVNNGKLQVSYDGGKSWIDLMDKIDVVLGEESITIIIGGTEVTIDLVPAFSLKVETTKVKVDPETVTSVEIPYTVKGAAETDEVVVLCTYAPEGFKVVVDPEKINVSAALLDGTMVLTAVNNTTGVTSSQAITFAEDKVLEANIEAYVIEAEGGVAEVSVRHNVDFTVKANDSWITPDVTKAIVTETVKLTVAANTGLARVGSVTFTGNDGSVATVVIAQKANTASHNITAMFGWQAYTDDAHGMTASDNVTLAVVGDYLILSNAADFTKMPVYNRWTGEYLGNDIVNVEGVNATYSYRAICNDEAGHLIMSSYTDGASNQTILTYAWKDGIDQKPTAIVNGGLWHWGVGASESGWAVKACGDVTGTAMLTYYSLGGKFIFVKVKNMGADYLNFIGEWPNGVTSTAWKGCAGKAITPEASTLADMKYVFSTDNHNGVFGYDGGATAFNFAAPASHWWAMNGYRNLVSGVDYIEVGGKCLMAVMNGSYANTATSVGQNSRYQRLCVAEIGANPTADSFKNGYIFDSREGHITGGTAAIPGSGYAVTGMSSPTSFVSGKTVLGENPHQTSDICFAKGADGSVQVYALVPGQMVIGYNMKF